MAQGSYFFCGIGGSGMLPLARYLHAEGVGVAGSDRAIDQGRADGLRAKLEALGIEVHPQDGSGVKAGQILVTSSAVEATIPDVAAADRLGAERMIRAELLASICNAAALSCGVAGTSGKSTTTAMLAHILVEAGRDPSVVNGAPMLDFCEADGRPAAFRRGEGAFLCEVDESDGSIALYNPSIGVLLNVSEDHKPMAELMELFGGFAERSGSLVLGVGSEPVRAIAERLGKENCVTVAVEGDADLVAAGVEVRPGELRAQLADRRSGDRAQLTLPLMGRFNIENASAALAAASILGVSLEEGTQALRSFSGSARRLQTVGQAGGVTVIDDFAHNPEKIAGSLAALAEAALRLHVFYQPHGYGPLRANRDLYEQAFSVGLRAEDRLFISEPAFFGGTVERTGEARMVAGALKDAGHRASYAADREAFRQHLPETKEGDIVVVMGARDDSLTDFAHELLHLLEARS